MGFHLEIAKQRNIGKRYYRLLVINVELLPEFKNGRKKHFAICKCDCGNIVNRIPIRKMVNGIIKSCGCYQQEIVSSRVGTMHEHNRKYPPIMAMARTIFRNYRRKHPGNITLEQFFSLSQLPCYYCGHPPKNICTERRADAPDLKYIYNGLDRVDSSKPHDYENCVPCCRDCNYAKRKMTQEEFFNLIRRIYTLHLEPNNQR